MEIENFKLTHKEDRLKYIVDYCLKNENSEVLESYVHQWNVFYQHYPELVSRIVADLYKVSLKTLFMKTNKRRIVIPRQLLLYYFVHVKKASSTYAASYFGKNHATANHACRVIKNSIEIKDPMVYPYFLQLTEKLLEFEKYL